MINRLNKVKAIIVMLLVSVMMLSVGALTFSNGKTVSAEQANAFYMDDKIELRTTAPAGLRFKAQFDSATKAAIDDADEFGFIIAPADYFANATSTDYLAENVLTKKIVSPVGKDMIYANGDGTYFATTVLYNILSENWDREFSAVAYYTADGQVTYSYNAKLPQASVNDLLNSAFFGKSSTPQLRSKLYTYFNYGGAEPVDFVYDVDGDGVDETITVPAHAIEATKDQFNFMLNLKNESEPAYALYVYTAEDFVTVVNSGANISACLGADIHIKSNVMSNGLANVKTFVATNFNGNIIGQGHTLTISMKENGRPSYTLFKEFGGMIKDTNIIVRRYDWGDGSKRYTSVIDTLNGSIVDSTITMATTRFGQSWNIGWGFIDKTGPNAVIEDCIFYDATADVENMFIREPSADTTVKNLALVTDKSVDSINVGCDVDGLYVFKDLTKLCAGTVFMAYNGTKFAPYMAGKFNISEEFGIDLATRDVVVRWATSDGEGGYPEEDRIVTCPILCDGDIVNNVVLTLNKNETTILHTADYEQLIATFTRNGAKVNQDLLVWTSSDESVLTAKGGYIVPQAPEGTAVVTVSFYGMSASCVVTVDFDETILDGVEIALDASDVTLYQDGDSSQLTATITKNGEPISLSLVSWKSSNDKIVSVIDGQIVPLAAGTVEISAYYFSVQATCTVTVVPNWTTVNTAEQFVSLVQSNPNASIKLGADIHVKNTKITGGMASVTTFLAEEFNGIIDGQDHVLTLSFNEAGRPHSALFRTLNGTVKNTNIVIARNDWGDDSYRYPAVFSTLNGSIIDCSITLLIERTGQDWKIQWSLVNTATASAVIENVIAYTGPEATYAFVLNIDPETVVKNVSLVRDSWHTDELEIALSNNVDGLYLFTGKQNAVEGKPAYKFSDGAIVACADVIDMKEIYGRDLFLRDIDYRKGAGGDVDTPATVSALVLFDLSLEEGVEIVLDNTSLDFLHTDKEGKQIVATTTKNGEPLDVVISWISSDESVVTVDANGKVTVVGVGEATISAGYYGIVATCDVVVDYDTTLVEGVELEMVAETMAIAQNETSGKVVEVTFTDDENNADKSLLVWTSSNENVATVDATGKVTPVAAGTATITATYLILSVSCEVTITPDWKEIGTGAAFVTLVQSDPNASIKLTADIVINNSQINVDKIASVSTFVADTFNGILDGNNHSIIISMCEAGRPAATLFKTLNGTMKNVNLVIKRYDWGPGDVQHKPAVIQNLNGTVENCIISHDPTRFGTTWNLAWAFFAKCSATAVVKNTILNMASDHAYHPLSHEVDPETTIENVAIMFNKNIWDTATMGLISAACNINGLYLFGSGANIYNGTPEYKFDSEGKAFILANGNVDIADIVGFDVVARDYAVRASQSAGSNSYIDTEMIMNVPDFAPAN